MTRTRTNTGSGVIRPRIGHPVKARVIGAGLLLAEVARRAGYSRSTMSDYLAGRNRCVLGQFRIYRAFVALAPREAAGLTMRQFWGELFNVEAA